MCGAWVSCTPHVHLRRGADRDGVPPCPFPVARASGDCAAPKRLLTYEHAAWGISCSTGIGRVAPYSETIFGILDEGGISHGRDRGSNMSALCHDYALHIKMKIQARCAASGRHCLLSVTRTLASALACCCRSVQWRSQTQNTRTRVHTHTHACTHTHTRSHTRVHKHR